MDFGHKIGEVEVEEEDSEVALRDIEELMRAHAWFFGDGRGKVVVLLHMLFQVVGPKLGLTRKRGVTRRGGLNSSIWPFGHLV